MKRFHFALLIIVIVWSAVLPMRGQIPGNLDLTFNGNGRLSTFIDPVNKSSIISDMLIQPDGKILLIGSNFNGTKNDFLLVRFLTSGDLDLSFNQSGRVITTFATGDATAYAATIDAEGKITVVGTTNGGNLSTNYFGIARYYPNGSPDNVFSQDGQLNSIVGEGNDWATCVAVQEDSKIVIAGLSQDPSGFKSSIALARYFPTGLFDHSFGDKGKVITEVTDYNGTASALLIQDDGKVLVGGTLSNQTFDSSVFCLVRYNPDGSLDESFGDMGIVTTSFGKSLSGVVDLSLLKSGKILALGTTTDTTLVNSVMTVVRYHPDGTIDSTFAGDGVVNVSVGSSGTFASSMAIQPDDKILLAGTAEFDTLYDFAIARLNANGTIDRMFSGDGIANVNFDGYLDFAESVKLQKDGKILLAGYSVSPDQKISNLALARFYSGLIIGTKNEVADEDFFTLAPNASSSLFEIKFTVSESLDLGFKLLDANGGYLLDIDGVKNYAPGEYKIPFQLLPHWPSGVYLVQMVSKNFRLSKPIVKL